VVVAYRVGWPDQLFIRGTLSDIREKMRAEKITRTALIFVGPAMAEATDFRDSALYDGAHPHTRFALRGDPTKSRNAIKVDCFRVYAGRAPAAVEMIWANEPQTV